MFRGQEAESSRTSSMCKIEFATHLRDPKDATHSIAFWSRTDVQLGGPVDASAFKVEFERRLSGWKRSTFSALLLN